ncbi:uncharacterized protein LOC112572751 isoform X1 [Pomacea canaliculata]|uniref:uncharacterized protein LOC112572751 isoform X1 n=1 Tax=Pomacea canaliculata TaxID=400727 RepID=UPI000D72A946|nr:uncharacterized protein LOC112572751 isoform X1 [Pomacea canaliculata]
MAVAERRLGHRGADKAKKPECKEESCCEKRCFVVTVVSLFLFVTFVSLPAGAFLIIHGRRNNSMAFQLGGALVVSIPIVVGIIFCLVLCLRRKSRKLTLNSSTHI